MITKKEYKKAKKTVKKYKKQLELQNVMWWKAKITLRSFSGKIEYYTKGKKYMKYSNNEMYNNFGGVCEVGKLSKYFSAT